MKVNRRLTSAVADLGSFAILTLIGVGLISLGALVSTAQVDPVDPVGVGDGIGTSTTIDGICQPPATDCVPFLTCKAQTATTCGFNVTSKSYKIFAVVVPGKCIAGGISVQCTEHEKLICAQGSKYAQAGCVGFLCGFNRVASNSCKPALPGGTTPIEPVGTTLP